MKYLRDVKSSFSRVSRKADTDGLSNKAEGSLERWKSRESLTLSFVLDLNFETFHFQLSIVNYPDISIVTWYLWTFLPSVEFTEVLLGKNI